MLPDMKLAGSHNNRSEMNMMAGNVAYIDMCTGWLHERMTINGVMMLV